MYLKDISGPQPVHVRDGMMGYMYVTYLMIERTGRPKAGSDRLDRRQAATGREVTTRWTGGRQAATRWTGGRQAATRWTGRNYRQESVYGAWYHVTEGIKCKVMVQKYLLYGQAT